VDLFLPSGSGIIPYLDELVPRAGDNDGVLGVGAEADAGNPLGVALVGDGVLAVTEGVPQLDGAVTRAGDDLAVVGREGDGQNVVGVANEAAGGGASGELPEAEGLVPRSGQSVGTVGGDNLNKIAPSAGRSFNKSHFTSNFPPRMRMNVHSRRRCGSDRGEIAWGNRTATRRG
jgi:hypothetical protein